MSYQDKLVIQSTENILVDGTLVPKLTSEQVMKAFNAVLNGNACVVTNVDNTLNFFVTLAKIVSSMSKIEFDYFGIGVVTYSEDGSCTLTQGGGEDRFIVLFTASFSIHGTIYHSNKTYDEIKEAENDGKVICGKLTSSLQTTYLQYYGEVFSTLYFTCIAAQGITILAIDDENQVFDDSSKTFVTTIRSSGADDAHIPTEKAVKDYVDSRLSSGGGGTVIM